MRPLIIDHRVTREMSIKLDKAYIFLLRYKVGNISFIQIGLLIESYFVEFEIK